MYEIYYRNKGNDSFIHHSRLFMIEKVLIIGVCIFFSVAFAIRNGYQRKEAGAYNKDASDGWHLWEFIVKCCFALAIALLTEGWFHKGFAVLMVGSIDFFFFPLVLNRRTGQRWDYLSDKRVDKFLKKIPSPALLTIKLILLLVSGFYFLVNPYG